ncbi:MAG TPA: hypothetical protein VK576_05225 [Thermoleophilia bacterium]|nr:hypothetical protein [Thermoleophilia bacterium]
MRAYVAFDDTDTIDADRGTGKVGRWFADRLPAGCRSVGVVRQQLLVHPDVPYTSHNSAAVVVVELPPEHDTADGQGPSQSLVDDLVTRATDHLHEHWMDGSDPGLCVAWDGCPALASLMAFGRRAAVSVVTQREAHEAARDGAHLSGHGGTNDGVIGAAAGVGLTVGGWNGRFIELDAGGRLLRDFPDPVLVGQLEAAGIAVSALDRDAPVPLPDDLVVTNGWLRPRLWGGRPVLPVERQNGSRQGPWFAIASLKRSAETPDADPAATTP